MTSRFLNRLAAAILLNIVGTSIGFAADQSHAQSHHGNSAFTSPAQAWSTIQGAASEIEKRIAAKDLKSIHEEEGKLSAALKYLAENSPMVEGDKKNRLDSVLKQAIAISGSLHAASDGGDQAKTEAEFKKIQGALKLIEAQYPKGTLMQN